MSPSYQKISELSQGLGLNGRFLGPISRWGRSREGESNEQVLKRVRFVNVVMLEMFRSTFNIYHKDVLCSPVLRALLLEL